MASIAKLSKGWRAQIATRGTRDSKVFSTKAETVSWATKRETEIREGDTTGVQKSRTLDEAFRRYENEVLVHKRGTRHEILRMGAIGRYEIDGTPLGDMRVAEITSDVLGRWRDPRLTVDKVKGLFVNRDLNLLFPRIRVGCKGMEVDGQVADHRRTAPGRSACT